MAKKFSKKSGSNGKGGSFKKGGGNRPAVSVALSVRIGKGKYKKGPSIGLWPNEGSGPQFRGTVKEERLDEVAEFLGKAAEKELPVSVALFKNSEKQFGKKRDEEEDEGDDEGGEEDSDDKDSDWDL